MTNKKLSKHVKYKQINLRTLNPWIINLHTNTQEQNQINIENP
jgi:hypothetical protein